MWKLIVLAALVAGAAQAQIQPLYPAPSPYAAPKAPGYGVPQPPKPPAPIEPLKPFGGSDTFKPFKGQHTDSTRGGLDPYPHTHPRGERHTY
jgi:hypothetical protein